LIKDELKKLIKENRVLDEKFRYTKEWIELYKEYKKQIDKDEKGT
jgi:arginyl-tRNA--protein-N-Asp/Glu arginylyltransferase